MQNMHYYVEIRRHGMRTAEELKSKKIPPPQPKTAQQTQDAMKDKIIKPFPNSRKMLRFIGFDI